MSFTTISAPGAEHIAVDARTGEGIAFSFDAANVTFDRADADLNITFENGGQVSLQGFFTPGEGSELPPLRLADGTEVAAGDFLKAMNPDLDISTAAGPSASNASSGAGDYADGAGDLTGSLDRLGSLGTDYWSGGRAAAALAVAGDLPGDGDGGELGGGDPQGPQGYHTRLIVTDADNDHPNSNDTFSFYAVDENGNLVTDGSLLQVNFQGNNDYFEIVDIAADGKITVKLTDAGRDALANGDYAGDMLVVSIDGQDDYRMPLIINSHEHSDKNYDYVGEEANANLGPDLKAEWYASDSKDAANTVFGVTEKAITLGGSDYNRVDIGAVSGSAGVAAVNTDIDVTKAAKGDVNIHAEAGTSLAYGLGTYGKSGDASSSVRGGAESTATITAETHGSGKAYGVFTSTNDGATSAHTLIDVNEARIGAKGVSGGATGIYATHSKNAVVDVNAGDLLEITAKSETATKADAGSVRGAHANANGIINLTTDADGKLVVKAELGSSEQTTYDMGKGGFFAAAGLASRDGGQINVTSSDINVEATIGDSSAHGTAAAVYSGWDDGVKNASTASNVLVQGYDGKNNTMTFTAKATDMAVGIIGTNSGNVTIRGGDQDDRVTVNATAKNGSALGVAAQAGSNTAGSRSSQVLLDGGEGRDTLDINSTFTGTQDGGTLDLFGGNKGAYGIAAAWGDARVTVRNFDQVNITADASDSNGYAYGIYSRNGWSYGPGVTIENIAGPLDLTITAKAADASKAFAIYNNGGNNLIQGGSVYEGPGDKITLNGHVTIATNTAKNEIFTGEGNDTVTINGDLRMQINNAKNVIDTGKGDDLVSISGNVSTSNSQGANEIMTGEGNDTVTIGGSVTGTGKNTIDMGDGNNVVNIGGWLEAKTTGVNKVLSGDDTDAVTVNGWMIATDGGKNYIDTGLNKAGAKDDTVTLNTGIWTSGTGSHNEVITDVVDINSSYFAGIWTNYGDAGGSSTHVTARKNVDIDVNSTSGNAYGVASQGRIDTENVIKAGTGIDINVVDSGTSGEAAGVYANWSSTAKLSTEEGDIIVSAKSAAGQAFGVNGNNNVSLTTNDPDGRIMITADGATNGYGIWGGTYTAGTLVNVDVDAGTGTAMGIRSAGMSNTAITADKVNIDVVNHDGSGANSPYNDNSRAMGIYTFDRSTTDVTGGQIDVTAVAEGFGDAYGLRVDRPNKDHDTRTTLDGDEYVNVTAKAGTGNAYGLHATGTTYSNGGTAENRIIAGRDGAEITAQSDSGQAWGIFARDHGGLNTVNSQGDITVRATGGDSGDIRGMVAHSHGENRLTAAGLVDIAAIGGHFGRGVDAWGSDNYIKGGDVKITNLNSSDAIGVAASYGGKNEIESATNIEVTAGRTGDATLNWASGLWSLDGGHNELTAQGTVSITAEHANITSGVRNEAGTNEITGQTVNINALDGSTVTYGMYGSGAASTSTVTGHTVNVNAETSTGMSYGMFAVAGATNHIKGVASGSEGMTVTITASAEHMNWAVALFASGGGSVNRIDGTDKGDTVSINGNVAAYDGGQNIIDTGAGNDFIHLNGQIVAGGLTIDAGADYDTLVLHAPDTATFKAYYESWLNEIFTNDRFADMSIEAIEINIDGGLDNPADIAWLLNNINHYNTNHDPIDLNVVIDGTIQDMTLDFSNLGVSDNYLHLNVDEYSQNNVLDGGDGNDTLHLNGSGDDLESFLAGGSNTISGFEDLILDMRNGNDDALNLDALLGKLGGASNVYIKGDGADAVTGSALEMGNYTDTGHETVDGTAYTWYSYQGVNDEVVKVYIQNDLIG